MIDFIRELREAARQAPPDLGELLKRAAENIEMLGASFDDEDAHVHEAIREAILNERSACATLADQAGARPLPRQSAHGQLPRASEGERSMQKHLTVAETTGALSTTARELIRLAMRENTQRAYRAQLRQWLAWCECAGIEPLPADPIHVANYLAERGSAGQSPSTLRTVVAAIKAAHDGKGFNFDSKAPVILKTLRGLANAAPRLPKQAEPIRQHEVLALLRAAEASAISRRDAALFALGYVFALRRSELVTLDLEQQGTGEGVLRITAKTIEVTFAKSKTTSGKPQSVVAPRAENTEAVKAIEAWLDLAGVRPGEPVFRRIHKGDKIGGRLHPQSVAKIVKARIRAHHENANVPSARAHEDAARYSGHSLRVGFAVTAAEAGADIRAIASVTRHRSLAMPARYAEKADQLKTSPHRLTGVGLKQPVSPAK